MIGPRKRGKKKETHRRKQRVVEAAKEGTGLASGLRTSKQALGPHRRGGGESHRLRARWAPALGCIPCIPGTPWSPAASPGGKAAHPLGGREVTGTRSRGGRDQKKDSRLWADELVRCRLEGK